MADEVEKAKSPSSLELINKEVARKQARLINKELTRLKRISSRPIDQPEEAAPAPMEADKTGSFIVIPDNDLLTQEIESAYADAEKKCQEAPKTLAAKKRWLKWK